MIKNKGASKKQELLNDEIRINQLLQDNENYLRRRCGLPQTGLSWTNICEIANPKKPEMAKIRLLDYLSKKEYENNYFNTYDKVENRLSKIEWLDVGYYNGVVNVLNEMFSNKINEFLDVMVDIANSMEEFKMPIEEIFRMTYTYYVLKIMRREGEM